MYRLEFLSQGAMSTNRNDASWRGAIDIIASDFLESMKDTAWKDLMEEPAEQFMDDD